MSFPARRRRDSMVSGSRARTLMKKKREREVKVLYVTCSLCQIHNRAWVGAARTQPLLMARLTEHYQVAHPGYTPEMRRPGQ